MSNKRQVQPTLILVSGAPASGKTHLAQRLSRDLHVPSIHRDGLKETLFDSLGVGDREWSNKVGAASWALLYDLIGGQLAAGRSIIAEANFYPRDRNSLLTLQTRYGARTVEVNCTAAPDTLRRRYLKRGASDDRHRGHVDTQSHVEDLDRMVREGIFRPLGLDGPVIVVDTTDFRQVDYKAVSDDVRTLTQPA